jgi:LEA14-like dessication related protein
MTLKKTKKKKSRLNKKIVYAVVIAFILIAGFFMIEKQLILKCRFEIENVFVDVESSQWSHATALPMDITLKVNNPSPLPRYLIKMDYELYADNELLSRGVFSDNIRIRPNEKEELRATMFLDFNYFSPELLNSIANNQAEYSIKIKPYFDSLFGRTGYESTAVR